MVSRVRRVDRQATGLTDARRSSASLQPLALMLFPLGQINTLDIALRKNNIYFKLLLLLRTYILAVLTFWRLPGWRTLRLHSNYWPRICWQMLRLYICAPQSFQYYNLLSSAEIGSALNCQRQSA